MQLLLIVADVSLVARALRRCRNKGKRWVDVLRVSRARPYFRSAAVLAQGQTGGRLLLRASRRKRRKRRSPSLLDASEDLGHAMHCNEASIKHGPDGVSHDDVRH